MKRRQTMDNENTSPKVALTENGVVVKNRAYRRRWINRAMMERKPSKKWYTKKKKGKRK